MRGTGTEIWGEDSEGRALGRTEKVPQGRISTRHWKELPQGVKNLRENPLLKGTGLRVCVRTKISEKINASSYRS